MNTVNLYGPGRVHRAVREYDVAVRSLTAAEELRDMLAANPIPGNGYYTDALAHAERLVAEMDDDLGAVMDRWTPEQCGL